MCWYQIPIAIVCLYRYLDGRHVPDHPFRSRWNKCWHRELLGTKMGALMAIFYILHLCWHFLSVTTCDVKYTYQPRYGYRCVTSSDTEINLLQTDRPQCVWKCLKLKTCQYINHNVDTGQCDLGLDKCASLVPAVGVTCSAFGPPRDTCVLWSSRQEHGHVPVEI